MWLVPFNEAAERTIAMIPIKFQTSRIRPFSPTREEDGLMMQHIVLLEVIDQT